MSICSSGIAEMVFQHSDTGVFRISENGHDSSSLVNGQALATPNIQTLFSSMFTLFHWFVIKYKKVLFMYFRQKASNISKYSI